MASLTQEIWELKSWHASRRSSRRTEPTAKLVQIPDDVEVRGNAPEYIPSLAEIQAACLEIQSEWSESERMRRSGAARGPREIKLYHLRHEV